MTDVSSENTVYTHVKGSRDTKPVESRIYDEISHARVSACHFMDTCPTTGMGDHYLLLSATYKEATARIWGIGLTSKYHISQMMP